MTLVGGDGEAGECSVQRVERSGGLFFLLDVLAPPQLVEGVYTVRIDVVDAASRLRKSASISPFLVFDGFAPKVVSSAPAVVPTVTPNPQPSTLNPKP